APGAPVGSVERGSLRTTAGTGRGTGAGQAHLATSNSFVPSETLRGQPQRFPRSIGDHRTVDDERRVAMPADAARRRLRHRTRGAPERHAYDVRRWVAQGVGRTHDRGRGPARDAGRVRWRRSATRPSRPAARPWKGGWTRRLPMT